MGDKVILLAVGNDYCRNEWAPSMAPPVSILALGSFLTAHDVPVELIDVQLDFGFGLTRDAECAIARRVAQYLRDQADAIAWVGISQPSNATNGITLAQEIHTTLPEIPIVFGGYFPSANYQLLLQKYPFITAVVRGDGEAAALQISRSLAQGQSFLSEQTPNLAWRNEGDIRTTPIQTMDLDKLPIYDLRLLRNKSSYQLLNLITSRGCPFHCNYCLENGMRPYAEYPAAWVDRQLEHMEAEAPNKRVAVLDPIFGISRKRTLEMCQEMRQHRFGYGVAARVDVLTPDVLPAMSEAGIELIFFGIESASPATLVRMNKVRSVAKAEEYLENTFSVLAACFENNVTPILGFMLGFPGDSEADLQATLEFAKKVRLLYGRVVERTGAKGGFISGPQLTMIYGGSLLAQCVEKDFPETVLQDPFEGERIIVSPSPGLDLDLLYHYVEDIDACGEHTPQVSEVMPYLGFPWKDFAASHLELTDEEGVTVLREYMT